MKIIFTRFPYESAWGGEESHTLNLAKFFRNENHEVWFMGSCPVLLKKFREENFQVRRIWGGRMTVTPWELMKFFFLWPCMLLNLWMMFRKQLTSTEQKIVFCLSLNEKILLTPIALHYGVRVIWMEHQFIKNWLLKSPLKYFYKLWSNKVTIVPISSANEKTLKSKLKIPYLRIRNIIHGINLREFESATAVAHKQFIVGTSARLIQKKGVHILLQSIGIVGKRKSEIKVEIIGEGEEQKKLEDLVGKLGLESSVSFLDFLPRNEYLKKLSSWDIFVLPSLDESETFGLSAAEALASGCKLIVSEASGISHYLPKQDGIKIVERGNVDQLSESITQLLSQKVNRSLLQNLVHDKFDERRMNAQYDILIHGRGNKLSTILLVDQGEHIGGAELFLSELTEKISKQYKIHIATSNTNEYSHLYNREVISMHSVPFGKLKPLGLKALKNYFASKKGLTKLINEIEPDLIVSNTVRTHMVTTPICGRMAIPLVWMQNDETFPRLLCRFYAKVPRVIFACSTSIADYLRGCVSKTDHKKIKVLYPFGVDGNILSNNAATHKKDKIGMIGKLIPWKGQKYFLLVLPEVLKKFPQLEVVLIGSTYKNNSESEQYLLELRQMIIQLALSEKVTLLPEVENVMNEISTWKLLVHASLRPEPFGRVIAEAMASGTVVVASPQGGPSEIIEDGVTGYLRDPRDTKLLSKTLINLLSDDMLRTNVSQKAQSSIMEKCNWAKKVELFEKSLSTIWHWSDGNKYEERKLPTIGRERGARGKSRCE